ncbi:YccS/YhfK family putative transporter [Serratia microhaemolytica]|uniref:YccS/YhfK family putative transporter n=1 Tax=Serratia microhaemolytica TaxID=2675110 RepID=UPI000FDCF4E2|nr:YccS/YhfK family putative transporter [Serratia microhaemolytica]
MWRRLIYHPEVNYALRQTLILSIPVLLGLWLGNLRAGLMFSLLPVCCNIAGLDTPHRRFFKRLFVGGSLFALSSFLLQQTLLWQIPLPLVMLVMALLLGVSGEISPLHGRLLPAALVAAIFSLSMSGHVPVWHFPLLYAVGTLWYGLFTWFWFKLWKEQPMRESLSQLYLELADYLEAKYSLLTQHTDPETALPPLLQRQQKVMDIINLLYQQLNFLPHSGNLEQKRLQRTFQVALDLQEHITVSLHLPEEVQKLVEQSQAEAIIRRNAQVIATRLRVVAADILYHRHSKRFNMKHELAALEKIATRHADNPVGHFCFYHFSHIARLLRTFHPLYRRNLMDNQSRLPFWPAVVNYLSLKSNALRNAARLGVTLAIGSIIGMLFQLPKPYWILLTIMLVSQNGYNATRVRIQHRAFGTFAGLALSAVLLQLPLLEATTLGIMLLITLVANLFLRTNYGLSVVGFTITAVYTLKILTPESAYFLLPRLIDTLIGCLLAFAATLWLWPQWQSGMLRKNAHQALERTQNALRLLLSEQHPSASQLAYARMRVNQAHYALSTSLSQAMQEPGFDADYLTDMRLWLTHSQFIVEHVNAITILVREHHTLPSAVAEEYLQHCEIALQTCQQRLEYDGPTTSNNIMLLPDLPPEQPITEMERHLRRILSHLTVMHTISALAWRQRPHHGIWLKWRHWR